MANNYPFTDGDGTSRTREAVDQGADVLRNTVQAHTADGDHAAVGAKADAANTDESTSGSVIAFLKGLLQTLKGTLTVGGTVSVDNHPTDQATETTLATLLTESGWGTRIGEVQATPTANTLLGRLKDIDDAATAIQAAVEVIDDAITGTEMQVDLVALGGAATEAKQDSGITELQAIKALLDALDDALGSVATDKLRASVIDALPAGSNNIGDVGIASISSPASGQHGEKTVAAAGTAEALVASSTPITSGVTIKALAANGGTVYVGFTGVSASDGFPLTAGQEVFVEIDDLQKVFVDVGTNGEGVRYIAT